MKAMQGYASISIHSPFLSYSGNLIFFLGLKSFLLKGVAKKKGIAQKKLQGLGTQLGSVICLLI